MLVHPATLRSVYRGILIAMFSVWHPSDSINWIQTVDLLTKDLLTEDLLIEDSIVELN